MEKATVIALMSVKNEAWILDKSLRAAAVWADIIIVADHGSEDGSRAIAAAHDKVQIIDIEHIKDFGEYERRLALLEAARQIPASKRLLVSIDADEMLSANLLETAEWAQILSAEPGQMFSLDLVNIHPNLRDYWEVPQFYRIFMDNGQPYEADKIHIPHFPIDPSHSIINLKHIKLLHFQFIEPDRTRCKHQWYLCWETVHRPHYHPIHLYRFYHQRDSIWRHKPLEGHWTQGYEAMGIHWRQVSVVRPYYWEALIHNFLAAHGAATFKWLPIWADAAFRRTYSKGHDPRPIGLKCLHFYLKITQKAVWLPYRLNRPVLYMDILIILFLRYFIGFDPELPGQKTRFFSHIYKKSL